MINARELFLTDRQSIWNFPYETALVKYEDGVEIQTRKKEIIFNRYCWELFTLFPNTPIPSYCTATHIIGTKYFNAETHIKLLEKIFKHICDYNNLRHYFQKDQLLKKVFQTVNLIYNEILYLASESVTGIDATDFVNLVNSEAITKIHTDLKPTPESVEKAYKAINSYINDSGTNNKFVNSYRAKSINENQANQCIGPRGFVTDLDRTVFRQPIQKGFIRGMGNLYEVITESRTAAKSLNANDTHIQISEYASRRIQLLTMSVTGIEEEDCHSQEYFDMFVTEKMLANMIGKYYLDTESSVLKCITASDKHLINTSVKLRTALGCKTKDPYKICSTCLGKISENFKSNSNLGYTMTSFLMEKLTQSILSTKHLTHSVKKSMMVLEGAAQKYFYSNEENEIFFNKDLNLKGLYLILPNNRMSKLVDVLTLQHTNISLTKIGELEIVGIKNANAKGAPIETVSINYKDRDSIITKELLDFIKVTHIESDSRGNFVIPLEGFNKTFPVFSNTLKETNVVSFVNRIASMIETNSNAKETNPYDKLFNLFTTAIEMLNVNLSIFEVIIYATTTYNSFDNDFRHGRNSQHPKCESKTILFRNRSMSQLLIFEDQIKSIVNEPVTIFSNKKRQNHPMDALFVGPT